MRTSPLRQASSIASALVISLAIVFSGSSVRTEAQVRFERVVVFGTSFSDPGNAFALTGITSTPPGYGLNQFLIPSAAYSIGGHHLSNGATWIEDLAASLHVAGSANPAFLGHNSGATNYAVGGARALDDGLNANLSFQVSAFLADYGGVAPSNALYVIEMGSNDVRDALIVAAGGGNPAPVLAGAVASIANSIGVLYAAGARNFLVWNVPDAGIAPAVQILDGIFPGAAAGATQLTQLFNFNLALALGPISATPGINILPFDVYGLIADIHAHPAAYGLTNVTQACVTPFVAPFSCRQPDEFLFWDGIHPTKAVHAIVGMQAAADLWQ
jgi:phospholipase/lecithinase/hemolysin